jgi:predicted RNase H-like HicB family nuclease
LPVEAYHGGVELRLTGYVHPDGDGYTAVCPELDVASQGSTEQEASEALQEAVDLLIETASRSEIEARYRVGFQLPTVA